MRAVREGAHPDILEFERTLVRDAKAVGVPLYAHCVVRSLEQQALEYAQGDSKVKYGAHNCGCAVDLIHGTRGWNMSPDSWRMIGHMGREIIKAKGLGLVSLAWGGDWGFYDPAHWEVADWRKVKDEYPWPKMTAAEQQWLNSLPGQSSLGKGILS